MDISIYDAEGNIVYNIALGDTEAPTDPAIEDMIPDGGGWIEGSFDNSVYYVLADVVTERPVLFDDDDYVFAILADGTDSITIPCPDNTVVVNHDAQTEDTIVTAADLVIKSVIAGKFRFTITPPFPYLPTEIEVSASFDD